jgi:hypothetical protein
MEKELVKIWNKPNFGKNYPYIFYINHIKRYKKSAAQKNRFSQFNLGNYYEIDKKNVKEAIFW